MAAGISQVPRQRGLRLAPIGAGRKLYGTWDDMSAAQPSDQPLKRTPLYDLHVSLGAKMVPFAGYEMPVQYPLGISKEHLHTRAGAGLFDVSHMGQAFLIGPDHAATAAALEALIPADILNLKPRAAALLAACSPTTAASSTT